jgi:ribose transport system permease protein
MQGFVASLAAMTVTRGIAFIVTNGSPVKVQGDTLANLVKRSNCYPVILIMLAIVVIFWFIQKYTTYGRIIIAAGSNRTAVELAGIRVRRYLLSAYMLSGALAAIAGIFYASRTSTGSASVGNGQELGAIAACVLGGANLSGGRGSVIKTFIGALILALIGNIMNLEGIGAYTQNIVQGVLIVAAVLLQGIKKD